MLFLYIPSYSRHAFVWQSGKCLYRVHTSNISIFKIWHSLSGAALTTWYWQGSSSVLAKWEVHARKGTPDSSLGGLPSLQAPFLDLLS